MDKVAEKVTHTPGPWTADIARPIGNHAGGYSIDAAGVVICGRAGWPTRAKESAANARLIAAAPELLDALKALTGGIWIEAVADENEEIRRLLVHARAAIAKAEREGMH